MIVAVYSMKGGVGKTTLAVNLAWAAAALSARRTLLWDLDGQAGASWILGADAVKGSRARAAIMREVEAASLIRRTSVERLDLLPADASLRALDVVFSALDKKKRLANLAAELGKDYDRIVIDCPPGLTDTTDQILRAADLVVVPVIPAPLSQRAFEVVAAHVAQAGAKRARAAMLPVFSMVDRRRALHRAALAAHPDWPVIPIASAVETMAERRQPLGAFTPASHAGVMAVAGLWRSVERRLIHGG